MELPTEVEIRNSTVKLKLQGILRQAKKFLSSNVQEGRTSLLMNVYTRT